MNSLKLLLVQENADRAAELLDNLAHASFDVFHVENPDDAAEALRLKNFDMVLLDSVDAASSLASAVKESPEAPLIVGIGLDAAAPGVSASVPDSKTGDLAMQLLRLQQAHVCRADETVSRLAIFDLPALRQQLAGDQELMNEIIALFFSESAAQIQEIETALVAGEFPRVSRLAHSLKGSLGSLCAFRSRYWADTLDASAGSLDASRCQQCLIALKTELLHLEPLLRSAISAQPGDSPALLH